MASFVCFWIALPLSEDPSVSGIAPLQTPRRWPKSAILNRKARGSVISIASHSIDDTIAVSGEGERSSSIVSRLGVDYAGRDVSVDTVLRALGGRSFGLLTILFALPNAVIPGISFILGAPVVLFAFQLAFGRTEVWLPQFMLRKTISASLFQSILARTGKFLLWIEKRSRPRWTWLVTGFAQRVLGLYIALIAIVLMFPVPFGNALPAVGIALMSVGLIERDGKAAVAGAVLGLLGAAYIATALVIGVRGLEALIGLV